MRQRSLTLTVVSTLPALLFSGCATYRTPEGSALRQAEVSLKRGRSKNLSLEQRAGFYLDAAQQATNVFTHDEPRSGAALKAGERAPALRRHEAALLKEGESARHIYNVASAELTVLLHEKGSAQGAFTVPSPLMGASYHLQWRIPKKAKGRPGIPVPGGEGMWDPSYFTTFKPAWKVSRRGIRNWTFYPGYGGSLVGVRKAVTESGRREMFTHEVGMTAPVTAVLDFSSKKRGDVSLALLDPTRSSEAAIDGAPRPLAANFSAPLAYYPRQSEFWTGLSAMLYMEKFLARSGLYMLTPYDPERVPVIFVHGLASTPQMWTNVINEIEADPILRGRCQYWTFWYPTGAPTTYSALQLRETLELVNTVFRPRHGYILVSHSMGGLVSRMQATTTGQVLWDGVFGKNAAALNQRVPEGNILKRALITKADPHIDRIIFICTPHRGSELAISSLGNLAARLITLPATMIKGVEATLGGSIQLLTNNKSRIPTGIQSLSPKSTTLLALDKLPIEAPHHSIIGDRGRGDTPNSSDGVVPYWSSHLESARSELIVPGPHSSYELPESITEIRRILREEAALPRR